MEGIPNELRVPAQLLFRAKITHHATYVEGTVKDVANRFGMQVVEDSALGFPTPLSFEIAIGGVTAAIDYNDLPQLPPVAGNFPLWLKFHKISAHDPLGNVRSFPPCSFASWNQYRELQAELRYLAAGSTILCPQRTHIQVLAAEWAEDLTRRRTRVRETLREQYGDELDVSLSEQVTYWRRAAECLVSVHVPGIWNNMLDRAQLQLMGFGVCTISPILYTQLGTAGAPVPGVHYVACRDDYSDLVERIEWCRANREACVAIGVEAKRLFERACLPEKIWAGIGRELAASGLV